MKNKFIIIIIALFILPYELKACTTFFFGRNNNYYFGRNYDWSIGDAIVMANQRGVEKTAILVENPISWVSKYGSITFNQFGAELPNGGMNEVGLVVEVLWLNETVYPDPDGRKAITEIQWVQYQLDNASTVEEVINSEKHLRVAGSYAPIHYMVSDASGNTAVIEFVEGKMVCHTNETMNYPVCTNNTYTESVEFVENNKKKTKPKHSLNRFKIAAALLAEQDSSMGPDVFAFDVLQAVAQDDGRTQWSIVYDLNTKVIYFKTKKENNIKSIRLETVDFSCSEKRTYMDIDIKNEGNVNNQFTEYSTKVNELLVRKVFKSVWFLKDIPEQILQVVINYPKQLECTEND